MAINQRLYIWSFLAQYESAYGEASKDASKYLANPINAFLTVKLLTADWKKVEDVMKKNTAAGTDLLATIFQWNWIMIDNSYTKTLLQIWASKKRIYTSLQTKI